MKTPDELSKGLGDLQRKLESIEQLESTISQVSKALCGKENATLDELLQEVNQVKSRLAQAERERDALHFDLANMPNACDVCVHGVQDDNDCDELFGHNNGCEFKWRGICPENTKEAAST